jgi:hypothetical protein
MDATGNGSQRAGQAQLELPERHAAGVQLWIPPPAPRGRLLLERDACMLYFNLLQVILLALTTSGACSNEKTSKQHTQQTAGACGNRWFEWMRTSHDGTLI